MNEPTPTCGQCKHFAPYRDDVTGRVHPSKKGHCTWPAPEITWPLSYMEHSFGGDGYPRLPCRSAIWKDTNASKCRCYEPKPKLVRTQKDVLTKEERLLL